MKRILIGVIVVFLSLTTNAGFVQAWSYNEMQKSSDFIAIVELLESTTATSIFTKEEVKGGKLNTEYVTTKFKVLAPLKGVAKTESIKVLHLGLPRIAGTPRIISSFDGSNKLISFKKGQKNKTFLVFLKNNGDGQFIPTTGQNNPKVSFVTIQPDTKTLLQVLASEKNIFKEVKGRSKKSKND